MSKGGSVRVFISVNERGLVELELVAISQASFWALGQNVVLHERGRFQATITDRKDPQLSISWENAEVEESAVKESSKEIIAFFAGTPPPVFSETLLSEEFWQPDQPEKSVRKPQPSPSPEPKAENHTVEVDFFLDQPTRAENFKTTPPKLAKTAPAPPASDRLPEVEPPLPEIPAESTPTPIPRAQPVASVSPQAPIPDVPGSSASPLPIPSSEPTAKPSNAPGALISAKKRSSKQLPSRRLPSRTPLSSSTPTCTPAAAGSPVSSDPRPLPTRQGPAAAQNLMPDLPSIGTPSPFTSRDRSSKAPGTQAPGAEQVLPELPSSSPSPASKPAPTQSRANESQLATITRFARLQVYASQTAAQKEPAPLKPGSSQPAEKPGNRPAGLLDYKASILDQDLQNSAGRQPSTEGDDKKKDSPSTILRILELKPKPGREKARNRNGLKILGAGDSAPRPAKITERLDDKK